MKLSSFAVAAVCVGMLAGCSTPEERAAEAQERTYKAQEQNVKERLKLVGQYQECVKQAATDSAKVEACDSYLKAAEALR